MRKKLAVVVVAVTALVAVSGAGGNPIPKRAAVPGRLSVTVPDRWHMLHGWLSDVIDPAPRLAVASFPAKLSRHSCECGFPNVIHFPRNGAFVFVWEYLHPSRRGLARTPRRPIRFHETASGRVRDTCDGPSDTFAYKDGGRVFQVEIYLGPAITPTVRAQVAELLNSVRVAPNG